MLPAVVGHPGHQVLRLPPALRASESAQQKEAILSFHLKNPLEGYRRLTFMMLDAELVAVSPSSVWRVSQQAGLLSRWRGKPSRKGTGFEQPLQPHQHWHIDVSYINLSGTFYYLCSVLDGYSRSIVHWDLRESMTEAAIASCQSSHRVE
jgi:putative transposase